MKTCRFLLLGLVCVSLFLDVSRGAALTTIDIDTGSRHLENPDGHLLSGGSPSIDHDGTIVMLGYFRGATPFNVFGNSGAFGDQFVSLVGALSVFGLPSLTVGDSSFNQAGNGEIFASSLLLFLGTNGGVNDSLFPPAGTPLAIRFFESTTLGAYPTLASPRFETVSNPLWQWSPQVNLPNLSYISINFDDPGLLAQSGRNVSVPGSNIRIPGLPEPSSLFLLCFAGALFLGRRSPQKRAFSE